MPTTPASTRPPALPALALALVCVIWGYNWVVMKHALQGCPPLRFSALRFGLAAISLLPLMAAAGQPVRAPRAAWPALALLGLLLIANFGCVAAALAVSGAGRTSVLVYTMPFWLLLISHVVLSERLQRWQWMAAGVALSGLVVLIGPGRSGVHPVSGILAVVGGLFWAGSVAVTKVIQQRTPVPTLTLTFWQSAIGCAGFALLCWFIPERGVEWSWRFGAELVYSGVLSTSLAWILFYFALERMPAGVAGTGTLATPVIGILCAWVELGERPTHGEAMGMALIGAGLVLLTMVPLILKPATRRF